MSKNPCIACMCAAERQPADLSFLAGIAFAVFHNNAAIAENLCEDHKAKLLSGAANALSAVRPEDRR